MFATRVQVRSPLVANRSRRAVRMAPAAVMDDVREVIAEQLGFDLEKVTPEAEFEKDLEADSLDTVEIMMALEEKFDITIEGAATDGIEKVSDVTNIIEKIQSGEIVVPAEKSDEAAPAAEAKAAPAAEAKAAPAAEAKAAPAAEAKEA